MNSPSPRERFLRTLQEELACGRLTRRRVLREIAEHLDDLVADLRAAGVPADAAVDEALRRMGEPEVIASAFSNLRSSTRTQRRIRALRSPAWVAVAAMSVVTAWAAELPPASGAKSAARPQAFTSHAATRSTVARHARRPERRQLRRKRSPIGGRGALRSP